MAIVYWIHLDSHTDIFTEGYVGISTRLVTDRFKEHLALSCKDKTILNKALLKYRDVVKIKVLIEGSENYCLTVENKLRPTDRIGWNTVSGGGKPPAFTGHTEEAKAKIGAASKGNKYRLGSKVSDETKAKISANGKGSQKKRRVRKPHSEVTKLKMSVAQKLRYQETKKGNK